MAAEESGRNALIFRPIHRKPFRARYSTISWTSARKPATWPWARTARPAPRGAGMDVGRADRRHAEGLVGGLRPRDQHGRSGGDPEQREATRRRARASRTGAETMNIVIWARVS